MCSLTIQDVPFCSGSIVVVLEGAKELVLLPRYPMKGVLLPVGGARSVKVKLAVQLHNDTCIPTSGGLQRLADAFGDGCVLSLGPGSCVLVPCGMHHAAVNLGRCVSVNMTYVQQSSVAKLAALDGMAKWFKGGVDVGTKMGSRFRVWGEDVSSLFISSLASSRVSTRAEDYDVYCRKLGYAMELAAIVERLRGTGCPQSSGINRAWRSALVASIHQRVFEVQNL